MIALFSMRSAAASAPASGPITKPAAPNGVVLAPSVQAEVGRQDLLAHGSDEALWVAQIDQTKPGLRAEDVPEFLTTLHMRGADGDWRKLTRVGKRVTSLANRGSQLAVLQEDGQWFLASEDGVVVGQTLPIPSGRLLTLANDSGTVWALARLPGGIAQLAAAYPPPVTTTPTSTGAEHRPAVSTAPSSAPAAAPATGPAGESTSATPSAHVPRTPGIEPAMESISLLRLGVDRWIGEADLPPDVARVGDEVSLAIVGGDKRCIAVRRAGAIRVYRQIDGAWQPQSGAIDAANVRSFRLLSETTVPVLWLVPIAAADADAFYFIREGAAVRVPLEATRNSQPAYRAAACAAGRLHVLYGSKDKGLYEQIYDAGSGAVSGAPMPVVWQRSGWNDRPMLQYAVVMAAMLFSIAASIRRRRAMQSVDLEKLADAGVLLAPLGLRALAGLIDAWPIAGGIVVATVIGSGGGGSHAAPAGTLPVDRMTEVIIWSGAIVYVLYTLSSEMIAGRTIGKMLCGLKVVSLDGTAPTRGQFAIRNVLRVIDVGLYFLPLMLVPFSPLRQRAGDVAAGTLVVQQAVPETEDLAGPSPSPD